MSTAVFLAVLLAAAMHASWNAILKVQGDRFIAVMLMSVGMGVAVLPLVPFVAVPRSETWIWLATSLCLHTGYKYFLSRAYEAGDLTVAYPLARGTAPLLTTLGSAMLLGEVPDPAVISGIVLLSGGVLMMSLRQTEQSFDRRTVLFALTAAGFTAGYTLSDGAGARSALDGLSYAVWLFLLEAVISLLCCIYLRGSRLIPLVQRQWKMVLVGGILTAFAYGISIWAMTKAPIAAVAALRETSILFAIILSVFFLGEKLNRRRMIAALAIIAGVIALRAG